MTMPHSDHVPNPDSVTEADFIETCFMDSNLYFGRRSRWQMNKFLSFPDGLSVLQRFNSPTPMSTPLSTTRINGSAIGGCKNLSFFYLHF